METTLDQIFISILLLSILAVVLRYFLKFFRQFGVPYLPSSDIILEMLLSDLKLQKEALFVDLGCGDGRVLASVQKKYPRSKCVGYEIDTKVFRLAENVKQENKLSYQIYKKNFLKVSFSDVNVVFAFSLPYLNSRIWKKMKKECIPWTLFYVNAFMLQKPAPDRILREKIWKKKYNIFVYKV